MTVWIPTAAATAEVLFFPLAAAIAVIGLRRSPLPAQKKWLVGGAMVFSIVAKIALASLGHNYDVHAYRIVSNIMNRGGSVYAETDVYNYAPVWACVVSGFGHLAPTGGEEVFQRGVLAARGGEHFHMWISAFLATIDVLIGLAIACSYSWIGALVFLLSPIGLLVSGFHAQFDNVAVLMGLLAWLQIRSGRPKPLALAGSSLCLGISLMVKHILFLFPIWLVFSKPLGKLRYRILYAAVAYGLFAGSFLPWMGDPASRAGILANVFRYKSFYGNSLLGYIIGFFLPISSLDWYLRWIPMVSGLQALWMALMLAAGVFLARMGRRELYLFYLLLVFASSPALAIQYSAIPMVAAAVFYSAWESWAFIAAGSLANLTTKGNVGLFFFQAVFPSQIMIHGRPYHHLSDLFQNSAYMFFLVSSQFCAGALLLKQWRRGGEPTTRSSLRIEIAKAAALVAAGGIPAVAALAKEAFAYAAKHG
jgi:hypothetical protein